MLKSVKMLMAASALTVTATPALAQEAEEPRTTYRIVFLDIADGADARWFEMHNQYAVPARRAAGQTEPALHWLMANNDWDVMLITEMHGGMANFDTHANPHRDAFMAAMRDIAGSEQALETLLEEHDSLIDDQMVMFSHTHP